MYDFVTKYPGNPHIFSKLHTTAENQLVKPIQIPNSKQDSLRKKSINETIRRDYYLLLINFIYLSKFPRYVF